MFAMGCSSISYGVGVVNGHMEKPDKEHGNGCFGSRVSPTVVAVI